MSDLTRGHYQDYSLTTARHPSETDERLACRIIAFALNAHEDLVFAKGLSHDQEPDLWQKSLDDRILKWVEVGQPDEKKLRRISGRSESIEIYCYQLNSAQVWWKNIRKQALKLPKLNVHLISTQSNTTMSAIIDRTMDLNCVIEDNLISISSNANESLNLIVELQQMT